jgi:hypothetical protein
MMPRRDVRTQPGGFNPGLPNQKEPALKGAVGIVLRHSDITKSLNQSSAVRSGPVRDVDSPGVKTPGLSPVIPSG